MLKMSAYFRVFFFLLICNGFLRFLVYGRSKLKSFNDCDSNANYPATIHATVKTVGNNQFLDGILNLTVPLDNTVHGNATVEMLIANNFQYLFSIKENKACDALHKYFGEFIYDLERHAQMIPGMCPMSAGIHRVHNFPLDIEKITTIGNFPFGTLRITVAFYDRTNTIYSCVVAVCEHAINSFK